MLSLFGQDDGELSKIRRIITIYCAIILYIIITGSSIKGDAISFISTDRPITSEIVVLIMSIMIFYLLWKGARYSRWQPAIAIRTLESNDDNLKKLSGDLRDAIDHIADTRKFLSEKALPDFTPLWEEYNRLREFAEGVPERFNEYFKEVASATGRALAESADRRGEPYYHLDESFDRVVNLRDGVGSLMNEINGFPIEDFYSDLNAASGQLYKKFDIESIEQLGEVVDRMKTPLIEYHKMAAGDSNLFDIVLPRVVGSAIAFAGACWSVRQLTFDF